jgi:hypothetical protein
MLFGAGLMAGLGTIPYVPPVDPTAIVLTPSAPGNLGIAPQSWTTQVSAPNRTQVKYYIGVAGQKSINVAYGTLANSASVPGYNRGDTINFTGYGANFSFVRVGTTGNIFRAQGVNGFDTITVPNETDVTNIAYTVDGAGGTSQLSYQILDLTNGVANLTVTFKRPGDSLIIKNLDESISATSSSVAFSGVTVRKIEITPHNPGDLNTAPASWPVTVTATGMTQVKWAILSADGTFGNFTVLDLTNGTVSITPSFTAVGQKLVVRSVDDIISDTSEAVAFSTVAKSIALSPQNPGDLGTAPSNWTTTANVTGLTEVIWAVFDANFASDMTWQTVSVVAGKASITCTFKKAGDRLVVKSKDYAQEAVSGQVAFNTVVVPPPTEETDDYTFVQSFFQDLTNGPNIEREAGSGRNKAYFEKIVTDSASTHVRFFVPTKRSWGFASDATLKTYFDSCVNAIAAGLKVFIDAMDVCEPTDVYSDTSTGKTPHPDTVAFMTRFAKLAATYNFDKRKIAFGSAQEWAYKTHVFYSVARKAFTAAMRAELPGYLLIENGANWNDPTTLVDGTFEIFTDARVAYQWHEYNMSAEKASAAKATGDKVKTWADGKKVFAFCGEWGKGPASGPADGVQTTLIPDCIKAIAENAGHQRPLIWTITNGTWWKMNTAGTLNLKTDVAAALVAGDTYIRKQAYWKSNTVTQPTNPTPGLVTKIQVRHRGQSNAYYADQYAAPTRMQEMMADLTTLTVDMISRKEQTTNDNTIHSGTFTYWKSPYNSDPRWINPPSNDATGYGSDSSTWTNAGPLTQTLAATNNFVSSDKAIPLYDLILHWEYDLAMEDSASKAAYTKGRDEVAKRLLAAKPKDDGKYIQMIAYCPYEGGNWNALSNINTAWAVMTADASRNTIMAAGNMMDGQKNTQYVAAGDNSHWGNLSGPRIYLRCACVAAKDAWTRGWLPTTVDLTDLPTYGPKMASASRGTSSSLTVTVKHDKGTALVTSDSTINWGSFSYTSNNGSHVFPTGGAILSPTTFRLDFSAAIPSTGTEKLFNCFHPYFRYRNILRDNWHSIRPSKYDNIRNIANLEFPMQRDVAGITF